MAAGRGPDLGAGGSELDRIRGWVNARFPVYETRVGPQSLLLAVRTDPPTLEVRFDLLRRELAPRGYLPILRRERGEEFIEVLRRPRVNPRGLWVNGALLAATLATTVFAGALIWMTYAGDTSLGLGDVANGGVYFAVPLLAILGLHELAHYAFARRHHLDASLPFFLPVPPPLPFGTFGAFVSIRDPFPDRKAMFDVSAAGPLVGLAAAVPISLGGLYLSAHAPSVPVTYCAPTILGLDYGHELFSPSLLWDLFREFFPSSGTLHPLAIAGWVGVLVTAINLLPIGALDGGRVFRALFGDRARYVSYAAAIALFGLSIFYLGWFIFGLLVLFLGLRNPPPLNDISPLGRRRYAVGAVVAAVLVAGFVVVPIQLPAGTVGLGPPAVVGAPLPPGAAIAANLSVPVTNGDPIAHGVGGGLSVGMCVWRAGTVGLGPPAVVGAPLPPGAAIAANLSVPVTNGDPIAHGFVVGVDVTNVTVQTGGGLAYLNASERAAWAATANWTFVLPNGDRVVAPAGASATLPSADYVSIAAGGTATVTVEFSNPRTAAAATVEFSADELCPPSGGGSAAIAVPLLFA